SVHKTTTLSDLLTHLYVLIPVFDSRKHYFVGADEMEKLLGQGRGMAGQPPGERGDHPPLSALPAEPLQHGPCPARARGAARRGRGGRATAHGEGRGGPGEASEPQRPASRRGAVRAAGQWCPARPRPRLWRGETGSTASQGQAVRGDCRHGRVDPLSGNSP